MAVARDTAVAVGGRFGPRGLCKLSVACHRRRCARTRDAKFYTTGLRIWMFDHTGVATISVYNVPSSQSKSSNSRKFY